MMTHAEHTATGAPLMTDAVNGLRERAAARPQATLLVTRGRTYGYASFLKRALAVAEGLAAAGVGRGARVALFLEDYDQFFVAMMGAWLAGDVVVPVER